MQIVSKDNVKACVLEKNKKNITKLLPADFAQRVVKVYQKSKILLK